MRGSGAPNYSRRIRFDRKRREVFRRFAFISLSVLFCCSFLLYFSLPTSSPTPIIAQGETSSNADVSGERCDFFWTIWMRNASEFRGRRQLVIDSLLIHHPQATVIIFSPTLNDTSLSLPYRQRGYRIDVIYCSNQQRFPSSCVFDDLRKLSILQRYGGIYVDLNYIFLQSLPHEEFRRGRTIFADRNDSKEHRSSIFDQVDFDTSLQLADLSQRSLFIYFSDHDDQRTIARGSLIDLLFHRYDLCASRSIISSSVLIHPVIYIVTRRKQGRFNGRDLIYLQTKTIDQRWNLSVNVANGTLLLPNETQRMNDLNQAELNLILHRMTYQPFVTTMSDTLTLKLRHAEELIERSIPIRIFHRYVSILTKTMGTEDRWPIVRRLIASAENYFPQTPIHIASDAGEPIDRHRFFNSSISNEVFIHDLPEDSGLSRSRNYLLDQSQTPFVFIMDDDFVFEDDSHLDLLLEILFLHPKVDLIAGKIPEDIEIYQDFAGFFLLYHETLELVDEIPPEKIHAVRFARNEAKPTTNPCRQVDFVPNVFLSRTPILASIRWDDQLKLAEHEDFFLRFAQANRTVFTCRYISTHHRQEPWWKQIDRPYYKKRSRVYQFYQQMLIKHRLKRLISFDVTNLDLEKIKPNA